LEDSLAARYHDVSAFEGSPEDNRKSVRVVDLEWFRLVEEGEDHAWEDFVVYQGELDI
jgi:hypothetical protein